MTRKTTSAVVASLGAIAAGTAARLLATITTDVVLGFEGVLDDDWGVPGDDVHRPAFAGAALVA